MHTDALRAHTHTNTYTHTCTYISLYYYITDILALVGR